MKTMSIIGIILFSMITISYLGTDTPPDGSSYEDAFYSGLFGGLFGLAYSIVGLSNAIKRKKNELNLNYSSDIIKLGELKEKGLLSEDEFEMKKRQLLSNL